VEYLSELYHSEALSFGIYRFDTCKKNRTKKRSSISIFNNRGVTAELTETVAKLEKKKIYANWKPYPKIS
jgi:hypothetical protein